MSAPHSPLTPQATPKQKRSLQSQEAILQATERLLSREGCNDFTLLDLSRESGMSVGGIYRRFVDKDGLMLVMQQRLNERMLQDFAVLVAEAGTRYGGLKPLAAALISDMAESLRQHAPVLRKIIEGSISNPVMGQHGMQSYHAHLALFKQQLLRYREDVAHPEPEFAIEFCFNTVFEMIASHLALGRAGSIGAIEWPRMIANLQRLCVNYLSVPD